MTPQLSTLLPILTSIPGVNIHASFQNIYVGASQRKVEQFEAALRFEVAQLNDDLEAGRRPALQGGRGR